LTFSGQSTKKLLHTGILEELSLNLPGRIGRTEPEFTWEKTNLVELLQKKLG